ncbi:MAG: VWA domain-containing protein [Chloroflexi bacterium]|nr:VWA domain-containing protein [Chloroflexota bacterium]
MRTRSETTRTQAAWLLLALALAGLGASRGGRSAARAQAPAPIDLIPISTEFNSLIGIDHHAPTDRVVISVNYPSGEPYNFELVAWDGSRTRFSEIDGLTDEIKIATVWASDCEGGFEPGELFTGTGVPGEIARIAADGSAIQRPWVTLPGETGLMRGSLFQDRYCAFGGDLLVVTSTGGVWRVDAEGRATQLAALGGHLEGLTSVPDDPARYGPWAGRLLTGDENAGAIYAIDAQGAVHTEHLGIAPEDFDIVPPRTNFYGIDFAAKRIVGAPAEAWLDKLGDLVIAQESGQLWDVRWDAAAGAFETHLLAQVGQWEHVTFSTAGLVEIPTATPSPVPSPTASPTPARRRIYLPILSERTCDPRPLELALVLDMSTSMRRPLADGRPKLEAVLEAAGAFLASLDLESGRQRVALAGFNDRAWTALPSSADRLALERALARLPQGIAEGTRLDLALAAGAALLEPGSGPADASRVLILLTDGLPNRVPTPAPAGSQEASVLAAAERARAAGIRLYTIGVGRPDAPELPDRIDAALLTAIAGDPARYFEALDDAALQAAWRSLSDALACPAAGRVGAGP